VVAGVEASALLLALAPLVESDTEASPPAAEALAASEPSSVNELSCSKVDKERLKILFMVWFLA
jgi:hypothetical protein